MTTESIVMYESDDAASIKTVTGWVDRSGRFWGNDEHMARYCGSTHRICEKNPDHGVRSIRDYCEECHTESRLKHFESLEKKVFAGGNLVIFDSDSYFFDLESLVDYCMDNKVLPRELRLMICEPNHIPEFYITDHCENELPEDGDESYIPAAVLEAAAALNKAIRESQAISWSQGKYAAIVSDDILTDEQKAMIYADRAGDDKSANSCAICGHPMPPGEEMFKFHGYSGPCQETTPDSDKTAMGGE